MATAVYARGIGVGEFKDKLHQYTCIWRTPLEVLQLDFINLLIQCFLSTVPLESVVRLTPQETQDDCPPEGW